MSYFQTYYLCCFRLHINFTHLASHFTNSQSSLDREKCLPRDQNLYARGACVIMCTSQNSLKGAPNMSAQQRLSFIRTSHYKDQGVVYISVGSLFRKNLGSLKCLSNLQLTVYYLIQNRGEQIIPYRALLLVWWNFPWVRSFVE